MAEVKYLDLNGLKKLFGVVDSKIAKNNETLNAEIAKKADKTELVGLATETYVDGKIEDLNISQYAKTSEVDSKISNVKSEILGGAGADYDTLKEIETWIGEHGEVYEALVSTVGQKADKSDTYTKEEVDNAIQEAVDEVDVTEQLGDYAKKSDLEGYQVKGDYATKSDIEDFITEEDLDGLATEEWVESQGFLTEVPAEYAKKSDIPTDYLTEDDLEDYVKEEDLPTFVAFTDAEIESAANL